MRVLHVDDLPSNRRLLQVILAGEKIDVVSVSHGAEAVEVLGREKVDVIVSDVLMPQMDGFEFCRIVKADPNWRRIPFIVLTSTHTDKVYERLAADLGADRFLELPIDPPVLVAAIRELAHKRRLKQPGSLPSASSGDDPVDLKTYNARLVGELEERVGELEILSRQLKAALDDKNRELTERRRVEDALRDSEARYRLTTEQTGRLIYDYDVASTRTTWYGSIERVTGFSAEEFQSVDLDAWAGLIHPDDRAATLSGFETARRNCSTFSAEYRFRRKDGSYITVEDQGAFLPDEKGNAIRMFGSVGDVSERTKARAALEQAQKLEAVATLAGGIAHDLNNVLTVVLTNCSLLQSELAGEKPEAEHWLGEVEMAVKRGSAMIRKLLAFSRHEHVNTAPVELPKLVDDVVETLRRLIPESIEIRAVIHGDVPTVLADAEAVEQMLFNLATNSRDAMRDGGTITISVGGAGAGTGSASTSRSGEYVTLEVSDDGTGMDPATTARALEPFFTTKPPGQGTGLGLAMVFGLMQQHGGFVHIASEVGRGTTVSLHFPSQRATTVTVTEATRPQPPTGGQETILVVEDEPFLRTVAARSLRRLGYTVLVAADGEEGLRIFEQHAEHIGLVFSDAIMPKLGGVEMLERLRANGVTVPFVLTSGYSEKDLRAVEGGNVPVLQKPWSFDAMARTVRQVLDGEKPA